MVGTGYLSTILPLGADFALVLREPLEDNRWLAVPPLLDTFHWIVRLASGESHLPGDTIQAWVTHVEPAMKTVYLRVSEFGRYPVADAMRSRYLQALRDVAAMLDAAQHGELAVASKTGISEFKGMVNRCLRKDQADWLTVYRAFGFDRRETVENISNLLVHLQYVIKQGDDPDEILAVCLDLRRLGVRNMVTRAEGSFVASTPGGTNRPRS
jgi:uncharacterized phage-associated protein